jgi:hypothetical protein
MLMKSLPLLRGASVIILLIVMIGCQAKVEHNEVSRQEEEGMSWIKDFTPEIFVKQEDSFQSALDSLLKYYGKEKGSASLADMRGYPNTGVSFLNISRKIAEEANLYTTFIELTFEEAKAEIAQDHPLISRRDVRGYLEDYVLFAGYDAKEDALLGFSILSEEPIKVRKEDWEQDFLYLQMNLSMIVADDEASIRKREENSQLYWLQIAAEAVLDMDDEKLETAIAKINNMGVNVRRAEYLNAYYQIFIKHELTAEVEQFIDKVYEAGPTISHAIEWQFLKYWTKGDRENAIKYMKILEQDQKFAESFLASLYIYEQIYTELGDKEQLEQIQEIIAKKELDPEYTGRPNN